MKNFSSEWCPKDSGNMGKGHFVQCDALGMFPEEVMPKVKFISFCFTPFLRLWCRRANPGKTSALPLSHASNPHENYSKSNQPEQGQEASNDLDLRGQLLAK